MPTKTRIFIVSILILLGGALFSYCVFLYPTELTAQEIGRSTTVTGSETTSVKKTSIGGAEKEKSGQNNQPRSEGKSPPKTGAI